MQISGKSISAGVKSQCEGFKARGYPGISDAWVVKLCGLIHIFLMKSHVLYLFLCLLAISLPPFVRCLFKFLLI